MSSWAVLYVEMWEAHGLTLLPDYASISALHISPWLGCRFFMQTNFLVLWLCINSAVFIIAEAGWSAGTELLDMALASVAPGVGPELSSFWASLKRHLTILDIDMYCTAETQHLEALGMLTALQKLTFSAANEDSMMGHNLSGKRLNWSLPHLISLDLSYLEQGEFVLLCPKLTTAKFTMINSLCVKLEGALLDSLKLGASETVTTNFSKEQLCHLKHLGVSWCSESGTRLIEHVCQMESLQTLSYSGFPAALMPRAFPRSLRSIQLHPDDWACDLPPGLRELPELEYFHFGSDCRSWAVNRPLTELLPMDSIKVCIWIQQRCRCGTNSLRASEGYSCGVSLKA